MAKPVNPPIYWSTLFEFESAESMAHAVRHAGDRFEIGTIPEDLYSRWDNPTIRHFEQEFAHLEGTEECLAFASGMAAISTTLLGLARTSRKHRTIVALENLYGGTVEFLKTYRELLGADVHYFNPWETDIASFLRKTHPHIVYLECPTNPTLRIPPIREIVTLAHEIEAIVVIDSTFATPILFQPARIGCDVIIHSGTKYVCGHHDLLGGVVCGSRTLISSLWQMRKVLGGIMDPLVAYMMWRGLKTLRTRVLTQADTAFKVAEFLENHPGVERVYYPGLPSHPDYAEAQKYFASYGSMIAFEPKAPRTARTVVNKLAKFTLAGSLGGVESLVSIPADASHARVPEELRKKAGITPNLIRLSIGLERTEELIHDLEQALE